jgi:NAD-dependent dihydropyrimidine dehydrogenase PreA subunit
MNLQFDLDSCTRCGACVHHCPGHVLASNEEGDPYEKYPEDCWYCGVCQAECPMACITVIFPYLVR